VRRVRGDSEAGSLTRLRATGLRATGVEFERPATSTPPSCEEGTWATCGAGGGAGGVAGGGRCRRRTAGGSCATDGGVRSVGCELERFVPGVGFGVRALAPPLPESSRNLAV